jgi:hypothetical protein
MTQCIKCGDQITPIARAELGHKVCLSCADDVAIEKRKSWCVIQEYGKGNYQFVTPETAVKSLKQTNQKNIRSDLC